MGGGGAYSSGPYSDVSSHGTYHQTPMVPETYNMREIGGVNPHGPAPGEVFDYNSIGAGGAAGAAGIGVARARSMRDGGNYGQALQEGGSPYPAFVTGSASPSPPPPHPYGREYTARGHELEVLENAGMGVHVGGAGAGLYQQQQQQQGYGGGGRHQTQPSYDQPQGLQRNKSLVSHEAEIVYPGQYSTPPPPPHQQGGYSQQPPGYGQQPQQGYVVPEQDEDDAYGGYVVTDDPSPPAPPVAAAPAAGGSGSGNSSGGSLPNPFDQGVAQPQVGGERRFSDGSEYEDEEPRRVLKVRLV